LHTSHYFDFAAIMREYAAGLIVSSMVPSTIDNVAAWKMHLGQSAIRCILPCEFRVDPMMFFQCIHQPSV
jgi:hypothetical protein